MQRQQGEKRKKRLPADVNAFSKPKRTYRGYSDSQLKEGLRLMQDEGLTSREAAAAVGIKSHTTLWRHATGKSQKKVGRPFALSEQTEKYLASLVQELARWRVPLETRDLSGLVQFYVRRQRLLKFRSRKGRPSDKWVRRFVRRHKLSFRKADKLKTARASVTRDQIINYCRNIAEELEGVPNNCIFNFDETNFANNINTGKVIVKRGMRRVEKVVDTSKQNISVMFCGDADGNFLPPMVVYKSKWVWDKWTEGGPRGTVYSHSAKGWFETRTFGQWFKLVLLPHLQKLPPGKKVIIGDNLGCHFSAEVISLCKENAISFLPLVPNSTHLCQPLDVAVFKPLKQVWSGVLSKWRSETGMKKEIPKTSFPLLLRRTCMNLTPKNLKSGFRTCGIAPVNKDEILKKIPPEERNVTDVLNQGTVELLKEMYPKNTTQTQKRGRKVEPGRNVADMSTDEEDSESDTVLEEEEEEEEEEVTDWSDEESEDEELDNEEDNEDLGDRHDYFITTEHQEELDEDIDYAVDYEFDENVSPYEEDDEDDELSEGVCTVEINRPKRQEPSACQVHNEQNDDEEEAEGQWNCFKCKKDYDDANEEIWVECEFHKCRKRFHVECSGIRGGPYTCEEQLKDVNFRCRHCRRMK